MVYILRLIHITGGCSGDSCANGRAGTGHEAIVWGARSKVAQRLEDDGVFAEDEA
jgi:hypothetical protein